MGYNSTQEVWNGCGYGCHAEVCAAKKLRSKKKTKNGKRKETIDLIVIRINKNGKLANSKPCFKCLEHLNNIKNFRIGRIYYSNSNGDIVFDKFSELIESEYKHVSKRFR